MFNIGIYSDESHVFEILNLVSCRIKTTYKMMPQTALLMIENVFGEHVIIYIQCYFLTPAGVQWDEGEPHQ